MSTDPKAIQIVSINNDRELTIDINGLSSILLQDKIRHKPLVVVSIVGDFRKGKSFLLNFLLRYLTKNGHEDWIGKPTEPLVGFTWRGGVDRETTGMWMWSEPFLMYLKNGIEVGVLLMDTQGSFDSEYSFSENAKVFALSALTSSVIIYNILHNLQEDNLHVLDLFSDYGRLAIEGKMEKPFQRLIFLIRDWCYPSQFAFGESGGRLFINKALGFESNKPQQAKAVRHRIKWCFQQLECFLMPYPGNKVATDPECTGSIVEMDGLFLKSLKEFAVYVLSPDKLISKRIGGQTVTGLQMMEYFKAYVNMLQGNQLPEPKTMFEATAEANNLVALVSARTYYFERMDAICGGNRPFVFPFILEKKHNQIMTDTKNKFLNTRKIGGEEYSNLYMNKLEEEIAEIHLYFINHNRSKSLYSTCGTFLTLVVAIFFFQFLILLTENMCCPGIAAMFTQINRFIFVSLLTYIFFKFLYHNDKFNGLLTFIDYFAETLSNLLLSLVNRTIFFF